MTIRVRALLITPDGDLLTIRRLRPGQEPYWVLPGGGVEDGESQEKALARELREEIAATADVHSLVYTLGHGGDCQYFYLARARSWSADAADRSGPEFNDPSRGEYQLQPVPLTADALQGIDLKPDDLTQFLISHLRDGTDLFALPDLLASQE
jgi:ADP-ribose pyrophosphatase YjhB (NUDIX family)